MAAPTSNRAILRATDLTTKKPTAKANAETARLITKRWASGLVRWRSENQFSSARSTGKFITIARPIIDSARLMRDFLDITAYALSLTD
jgi:hypothetical protein